MIKQLEQKSKLYYLIANIIAILLAYFTFSYFYNQAELIEEIVKKDSGYVKMVSYNYGPALTISLATLIFLIILLALLYKKTKLFSKIELVITYPSSFFKTPNDYRDILSIEKLSPLTAIKSLYKIIILVIIVRFIISLTSIATVTAFAFRYNPQPFITTIGLSIFVLIVSLLIAKLVFVLIYNHFLLVEKKLDQMD